MKFDEDAHGSGFDRVGAFQDGYDNGLAKCKNYRDDDPIVIELPFSYRRGRGERRRRTV